MQESHTLRAFEETLLNSYKHYLANTSSSKFWDVIVISARSSKQATTFEQQLQQRKHVYKTIPTSCDYHVLSDDKSGYSGRGSGWSTFYVMRYLDETYGDALFTSMWQF